jgi:two-component system, OmpR family, response regulator ResD
VLLVDDDEINLYYRRRILTAAGYEVATVTRGVEALEVIQREAFDVVVLDFRMPGRDGEFVLRAIRQGPRPEIPVIMLTAGEDLPVEVYRMADACILKLEGPDKTLTTIAEVLRRTQPDL